VHVGDPAHDREAEAAGGRSGRRLHGRDHLGLPVLPPAKPYPDRGDHDPGAGVVAPRAELPGPGEEADDEPGRAARVTGGSCLHDGFPSRAAPRPPSAGPDRGRSFAAGAAGLASRPPPGGPVDLAMSAPSSLG